MSTEDSSKTTDGDAGPESLHTRFGNVELRQKIGQSGFGVVYLARDALNRDVAIKLFNRDVTDDQMKRFQHEAKLLARIDHPSILPVYAFGFHDKRPFLVMKYVSGTPLPDWAREHRGDWKRTAELFAQLAEGLSCLHEGGILHRDISPNNVLVTEEGTPRLVDFGITASQTEEPRVSTPATSKYAAPELGSEPPGPSADVFALGALLHDVLAGAHTSEPRPTDSRSLSNIPEPLAALYQAAQSPRPSDRPSASTFAVGLRELLAGSSSPQNADGIVKALLAVSWSTLIVSLAVFVFYAISGAILLSPHLLISLLAGLFGGRLGWHLKRTISS